MELELEQVYISTGPEKHFTDNRIHSQLVGLIIDRNPQVQVLATKNLVPFSISQPSIVKTEHLKPIQNLKLLIKDDPV